VGVEYHKRFDRRSLVAKRGYARGGFSAFVLGEAKLIEPYYYRFSNFQNWFTCDHTDPFTYIGCHYVDLVYFITGLKKALAREARNTTTSALISSALFPGKGRAVN
jgi:predicted dehydrogenase